MTVAMSREVLERLLPYVPPYWVQQALAAPGRTLAGRQARLPAAVLFCDISGFTPIAEALSQRGREGIEELSALLDRYLASMSELVVALGGQVAKFAGDSLVALFPRADADETHLGSALQCALRMRETLSRFARPYTSAGTFALQSKIGISEGSVYTTTVGDEENGMLPVFAGRAIVRAMQAEDHADPGEILVDALLTGRLPGHLDVGEARDTFRLIDGVVDVPVLPPSQPPDLGTLTQEGIEQLVRRLAPYLDSQAITRMCQGARGVYSEYRRVTVMFVRFDGLDYDAPWEGALSVGDALQAYCSAMRDCILRHGGRLNEVDITVGGGTLVALFGAPTAHEDDELRAVSCAWEIHQAIAGLHASLGQGISNLRQCASISSGLLFVGDVGGKVRRAYAAVGDEVNLASRLSYMAGWGETLVTSWIRRRAGGRFEFEARGEVEIRGKAERVPLALLRAPRSLGDENSLLARLLNRRFLVGRDAELEVMAAVRERAIRGEPQLLILSGEAGVGKSRLAGELVHEWSRQGGAVYVADCARGYDGGQVRQDDDRAPWAGYGPWIALLDGIMGIEDAGEWALVPAGQQRVRLCEAWERRIQELAASRPLLLVLEGVHQLGPDSWALFHDLMHALPGVGRPTVPVLVCATYRPTGEDEWEGLLSQGGQIGMTRLVLEPLTEADSFSLAQHLLRDVGLQADLAPALVRQARGNPLYLQEMIHALAGSECPAESLSEGPIVPDRIADTVLAQLDSLGEDYKLTLRIAAVIGQVFSMRLLQVAHLVPPSRHDLAVRLARLERMHIVRLYHITASGDPPDVYYRFRHALAQRVIYASMLRADRERFHRRVGHALEQVCSESRPVETGFYTTSSDLALSSGSRSAGASPSALEASYGLLADHFQQGNLLPEAISYALLAGQGAVRERAVREALVYYGWVQDLLLAYERTPAAVRRCVQGVRISLLLGRGSVYHQLLDMARAREDYEAALELAGEGVDVKSQVDALLLLGSIAIRQADYVRAQTLIYRAMQRLAVLDEPHWMARARLLLSQIAALRGGREATTQHLSLAAIAQAHSREPDPSTVRMAAAYQEWLGTVFVMDRPVPAFKPEDENGVRSGEDLESLLWLAEVAVQRGKWGDALGLARRGMALGWAIGTRLDVADAKRVLAWLLMHAGAYQEAADHVDEALATFAEAGWTTGLADGYWLSGEILLAMDRHELAAERFDQALALGRQTHTIQAVVRAQIGLGKLAAARARWREGQRLCTEARARAVWAKLGSCTVAARLGLAGAHLRCNEWQLARAQAKQALDLSDRLGFAGAWLDAALMLGEALDGLGQAERAQRCFEQAYGLAVQLAGTLPLHYTRTFWSRPGLHALRERMAG